MPQLLTISLNPSGSIKLHIVVKWLPPPPPPAPLSGTESGQLAYELQLARNSPRITSGSATIGGRSNRQKQSPGKGYKTLSRTVRQHKSMSLNPHDVGELLNQLTVEDIQDPDSGIHEGPGRSTDPSSVSSLSPLPSTAGSNSVSGPEPGYRTWRSSLSPSSDSGNSAGTLPRTSRPGAGIDRIRALALQDLNAPGESSVQVRKQVSTPPRIPEPGAAVTVTVSNTDEPLDYQEQISKLRSDELSESIFIAIAQNLEALGGKWSQVTDFEQSFSSLRTLLFSFSGVTVTQTEHRDQSSKNKYLSVNSAISRNQMRHSIKRKKNQIDLHVDVAPSLDPKTEITASSKVVKSENETLSTGWSECDTAIVSHLKRALEDLERLKSTNFWPSETGNQARQLILDSLNKHSSAIRQVLIPLVSAAPDERSRMATELTASLLQCSDSNSLWSALCRSPSSLIALPASTLHVEITKRVSSLRSRGPSTTYGPSPSAVADRVMARIGHYYSEYVSGSTLASISTLAASVHVVTLSDFAYFAGSGAGIISHLEDFGDEMKFCHCLEPAILRRGGSINGLFNYSNEILIIMQIKYIYL